MSTSKQISDQKAAARKALRGRRDRLDVASRVRHSAAIQSRLLLLPEVASSDVIFCFISSGPEVSTHAIIDQLMSMGKTVLAPKILPGQPMRAVPFRGWDKLAPGVLGIPAPVDNTDFPGPVDLVITPGLGFTAAGARLGYGRGYYDRWFATHEHGLRAGIAFECQVEDWLPVDATDIAVHVLITEQRTLLMPR